MNLGVFLAIGESLTDLKRKGQIKRLVNYNIRAYSQAFDKVYIFSYENEKNFLFPKNCYLIPNTSGFHRYIYSILLPIIKREEVKSCGVLRGLQLSGGIPASIAKMIFRKKIVINYGYDYSKFAKIESKSLQSFLYKLIEIPIIKLADAVIVTSRDIKRKLAKKIKQSKTFYIPNGVDTKLFKKINSNQGRKFTVLFIGRLEKQKNLENLIKALSQFKNIRALFYGQGSLKKALKSLANKLKVDLTINNPLEYQKIPRVLASADVFALPSLEEGNPKILLEAMACEKAVIGTKVSGIKEIIASGYNGLLTDVTPKSIAVAIDKLQDNGLRKKLGKNARQCIIKNYDINRLLSKEVGLLKKVAMQNGN